VAGNILFGRTAKPHAAVFRIPIPSPKGAASSASGSDPSGQLGAADGASTPLTGLLRAAPEDTPARRSGKARAPLPGRNNQGQRATALTLFPLGRRAIPDTAIINQECPVRKIQGFKHKHGNGSPQKPISREKRVHSHRRCAPISTKLSRFGGTGLLRAFPIKLPDVENVIYYEFHFTKELSSCLQRRKYPGPLNE